MWNVRSLPELSLIKETSIRGFTNSTLKPNSLSNISICTSREGELVMVWKIVLAIFNKLLENNFEDVQINCLTSFLYRWTVIKKSLSSQFCSKRKTLGINMLFRITLVIYLNYWFPLKCQSSIFSMKFLSWFVEGNSQVGWIFYYYPFSV